MKQGGGTKQRGREARYRGKKWDVFHTSIAMNGNISTMIFQKQGHLTSSLLTYRSWIPRCCTASAAHSTRGRTENRPPSRTRRESSPRSERAESDPPISRRRDDSLPAPSSLPIPGPPRTTTGTVRWGRTRREFRRRCLRSWRGTSPSRPRRLAAHPGPFGRRIEWPIRPWTRRRAELLRRCRCRWRSRRPWPAVRPWRDAPRPDSNRGGSAGRPTRPRRGRLPSKRS
mmetsp:Transcript_51290/g.154127  ORF Transcript_51290/g.154127 Transcript_51290/m.154127 type:complete len:228 (+) Transcript_51290:875-1558(+)